MHLLFYAIHLTAMLAIVSGRCHLYGNACYGGHGKRSDLQQTDDSANDHLLSDQIWTTPNWNPTGLDELSSSMQERGNTKPLLAPQLESFLLYNDIPQSAEHSRYLNQEDYNN